MRKQLQIWAVLFLAAVMVVGLNMLYGSQNVSQAAVIPTPAFTGYSGDAVNTPVKFWADNKVITQSGASTAFVLADAEALDIQYVIDQGTVNTVTLKLQFSNDNANWTDGVNVVASNAADATNLLQFNNFGYYTRLYATVSNTSPLTLTNVSAVARR